MRVLSVPRGDSFPISAGFPASWLRILCAHKSILCEPLLGPIELSPWLTQEIEEVSAGGESGPEARVCRYEWVQDLSRQCHRAGVPFHFRQTGALFEKDGRLYRIPRQYQSSQARKAGIDSR